MITRRAWLGCAGAAVPVGAQFGPPVAPKFEAIGERLEALARQHARVAKLEVAGKSVQGRPVYALRITDPDSDPAGKEHVLLTALHAGQEHSGATSTMAVIEWLLSGDVLAREVRKGQSIIAMPVVNPDSYVDHAKTSGLANSLGRDPYTGWTVNGPEDPERCPEAVAVQRMMDEHEAEVHADLHGNSLPYPGAYQIESTGRAYSNISLRPYHHEVIRLMDEAAMAAGYPMDRLEEDAERIFGGSELGIEREKLWAGIRTPSAAGAVAGGVQKVYAALYGYNRFHTMVLASEIGWDRSGLVRHQRLLRIGNEVWPGERYAGYPVRVIKKEGLNLVTAYGTTASARRRSRVELWNLQGQITHGENRPHAAGRLVYVCATSPKAAAEWLGETSLSAFTRRMREHPKMAHGRIAEMLAGFPEGPGQWGPTANIMLERGPAKQARPIEHGLALRLRLPFPKARNLDVWLNDAPLKVSESDGYVAWSVRGFTVVQIHIPPERSRREELFVASIRYDPQSSRGAAKERD